MVSATRSSSRLAGESSKIPKTSSKRTKGKKNASPSPEPEETIAVKAGPSRRTSTRRSNRKRDHRQDIKEPFSTVKRRRTSTRQSRSTGTSTAATPAASFSGYSHDGQTETPATHLSDFSDDDEALDQMLESHSLKRLATTVEADLDDEDLDLMLERDPTSSRPFKADLDDEDLDLMLECDPSSSRPFKRLATPVDASLDDDNSEDSDAEHQSDVMDEDEDYYADQEIQHYTQEKAAASAAIGQSSSELSDVPDEFGSEPDSVSDEDFYNCMLSCEPVQRKGKAKGRAKSILPSYDQESDDSDDSCYRSERYLSPEDDDESRFFRAARFGYTVSRRRSGKDVAQQFHGPEEKDFDKNFINKYEYDESGEFTGPNPEDTRFLVNHDDRHTLFDDYIAHDFAIKDKKKDHVPWIVPWNPLKKRIAAEKDAREAARKAAIAAFVATTDPEDYIYHQSDEEGEDGAQPIGRIPFFYESDAEWRAGRKYTKMQCQDFTVKAMGIKGREPDYDHRKDWLVAAWTAGDIFPLVRARHGWDRADVEHVNLFIIHPELRDVWKDLDEYPRIRPREDPQPPGLALNLLPFQKEGLHWLRLQEQSKWRGGILADEMGMGKTIQTLCLIMTDPNAKPNLVVAPTVAIMQWKSEIEKYTGNALRVYIFHGAKRTTDWKELSEYNVILTSYNLLESVYRKQESGYKRKAGTVKEVSALHQVDYHRVILDEAHNIKDRSCNTAKAVFALKTKYKLCLSGTPLQNRIGELFSLLRFLEVDPFAYYYCRKCPCKSLHWKFSDQAECDKCGHGPMNHVCFFNHECLKPIQKYGYEGLGEEAFLKIKKLLKHIMLRRTKREREDDLGLPPKIMSIRRDKFSEEELDLYNSIYSDAHRKFDTYVAQGVLLNNYANIFALITRMRQIADHPDLFLRKEAVEGQNNNIVCGVCDEIAEEPIKSKCHHTFCRDCAQRYITGYIGDSDPDCPKCHIPLIIDLTAPAIEAITAKKSSIINRIDMSKWRSSTKIEALCEELHKLRRKDQTVKSIVFSQFTSMLQLIEWRLKHAGFKCVMLEGTMSPAQRDATIQHFMKTVDVDVFLVSLRAGGVALNLIEASQVFLMEPWWNPSVEWQAADRIHRIGQTRVCRITRLIIEDSIESRIVELQEKKASMIDATVNADYSAMNKLTAADMEFLFQN